MFRRSLWVPTLGSGPTGATGPTGAAGADNGITMGTASVTVLVSQGITDSTHIQVTNANTVYVQKANTWSMCDGRVLVQYGDQDGQAGQPIVVDLSSLFIANGGLLGNTGGLVQTFMPIGWVSGKLGGSEFFGLFQTSYDNYTLADCRIVDMTGSVFTDAIVTGDVIDIQYHFGGNND